MSSTSFFCVINASDKREKVTTRVREGFFLAISEINNLIKRSYQCPITEFQWYIALLANNVDFFATHRSGMNFT